MAPRKEFLRRLGERIAKERRKRGLTLEKLAYEMDLSKGNLSDIEHGRRDARITTLVAISQGLCITLTQLLGDIEF